MKFKLQTKNQSMNKNHKYIITRDNKIKIEKKYVILEDSAVIALSISKLLYREIPCSIHYRITCLNSCPKKHGG